MLEYRFHVFHPGAPEALKDLICLLWLEIDAMNPSSHIYGLLLLEAFIGA